MTTNLVLYEQKITTDNNFDIRKEKNKIDELLKDIELKINNMVFDLSNDHPDLVTLVNAMSKNSRENSKRNISDEELKEIWRIIASKCHPDKNKKCDPKLNELFLRAKKVRDDGDTSELYFCYLELLEYEDSKSLVLKLLKNSEVIKNSLENLKNRYSQIKNGFFGKLYDIYTVDRHAASLQYKNYLLLKSKGKI